MAGTLGDLASAFGTTLQQVSSPDPGDRGTVTHRYRQGPLSVPAALDGVVLADLNTYFGGLGIAVPSITAQSVDGASNAPGSDPAGADIEVALDIDVIGAVAPGN